MKKDHILATKSKYTTVVKSIILAVLSASILLVPAEANAGFKEDLLSLANRILPFTEDIAMAAGSPTETPAFPEADNREPLRTLTVIATAYSSDPYQTDDTPCHGAMWTYDLCEAYTKYGLEDTIAANFLPLGTLVRFPDLYGDKIFVVRDRMNAKYNYETLGYYRIDFYKAAATPEGTYDNDAARAEAIEFGIKRGLKMEIIARVK